MKVAAGLIVRTLTLQVSRFVQLINFTLSVQLLLVSSPCRSNFSCPSVAPADETGPARQPVAGCFA